MMRFLDLLIVGEEDRFVNGPSASPSSRPRRRTRPGRIRARPGTHGASDLGRSFLTAQIRHLDPRIGDHLGGRTGHERRPSSMTMRCRRSARRRGILLDDQDGQPATAQLGDGAKI